MANLNKVILIGNLTRDPEVTYTPKGTAVAKITLAINRQWTTEAGEKQEEVTFVDVEAWGRKAEVIGEYCKKGRPLLVEGRLKLDTWDDKTTGQKRSKMKVVIENIEFLPHGNRDGDEGSQQERPAGRTQSRPTSTPKRPPHDPDLDTPEDDIPF